jgi:hypothetical protein
MSTRMLDTRTTPRMVAAVLSILGGTLLGCGSDPAALDETSPECAAGALESDLDVTPLAGPAVSPETGDLAPPPKGAPYIVSATYGIRKTTDAALERWQKIFGPIQEQLASQPGLLAFQLGSSTSCNAGRTLAVWASAGDMYGFVASDAHVAAMDSVDELAEPGFVVIHWEATTVDQTSIEEGARRLAELGATAQ